MASFIRLELEMDDETQAILDPKLVNSGVRSKRRDVQEILNLFAAVPTGRKRGIFRAQLGAAYATQTVVCDESAGVDDNDTLVIGPVTLTLKATASTEDHVVAGASDITFAADLATVINAHSVLKNLVVAESDGVNTVTITSRVGGAVGNQIGVSAVGAAASQTIGCDFSDAIDGTDTVTIGAVTLSVEASPGNENEFDSGADDIEFAANLTDAINDHSVLGLAFSAVTDGVDTVTVTALDPGVIGNQVALSEAGIGFTLGGAVLAGGAAAAGFTPGGTHLTGGGTDNDVREMDFGHT